MPETRNSPDPSEFSLAEHLWLPADWTQLHVAVALSGGADSVALLRVLHARRLGAPGAGQLLALHVNHQLRGQAADADAQWCGKLCASLDIPLQVLSCDTASLAAQQGDGIEAAARAERYRQLTAAAEQAGVRYLAIAHTRDDQLETILFRILRGTGLRGLTGIPRDRALTPVLTLIRPLLACSREQVVAYLSELQQDFRTDSTNDELHIARNRLRHELLPLLRKQYNHDLDSALLRLSQQAGDAQQFVEHEAAQLLDAARVDVTPGSIALSRAVLGEKDPALVAEALRIAWRRAGLPEQGMTYQHWQDLVALALSSDAKGSLNLPGHVRARVRGERLVIE